ncbi:MAG TPA: polysaccharide deacetylase family protein, partial [Streptosporangiaceae bacterium]
LGAASYSFVLLSIPYHTPQLIPPRIQLTSQEAASFRTYPRALREVPVLTWRDISRRNGHLVVTPQHFATQLAALRRAGFRSVSPGTLAALAVGRRVKLSARPVVLTFDDGLATDWTTVDPILRRYGFTAVVFIDPANIAAKSPSYFLTHDELRAMTATGRWDVGVQLAPRWRSATAISRAAWLARNKLQAITGTPVSAYAWPVLDAPSTTAWTAPTALYSALRWNYAEIFGRPAGGAGNFVVARMGDGPLPRIEITKTDTLAGLSLRLRTGVEGPPPSDPLTLPWRPAGGRCLVSARAVTLTARHFALCTVVANGAQWRDYGLSLSITARAGTTAIIELRNGTDGCLEVAIGQSELSIKQRTGSRWRLLRQVTAQPAGLRGTGAVLVGGGRLPASVSVTGRMLSVRAGRLIIRQQVSRMVGHGIIGLGMVSPGGQRSLTYHRPAVFIPSAR